MSTPNTPEEMRKELISVYYKDFNDYNDIDVKFEDVYSFIHQQLQKAVQEENLKQCCCVIENSKVIERCKLHGDELQKAREKEREKQGKRFVTLMNQALGEIELPEHVWKKVAKVNQLILDK